MCYLVVVVVVFNQMMCSFQVSSRKSERMCGQERAGLSSEKEDAIHSASLGPPQLCEKTSAAWHLLRSQEVGMVWSLPGVTWRNFHIHELLVLFVGHETALEACQLLAFSLLPRREGTGNPCRLKRKIIAELSKEVEGVSCPVVKWFMLLCAWCALLSSFFCILRKERRAVPSPVSLPQPRFPGKGNPWGRREKSVQAPAGRFACY